MTDPERRTGEALAAELKDLLNLARKSVPALVEAYLKINGHVADTSATEQTAFSRPSDDPRAGASTLGVVYTSWAALRDEFQQIVGQTAINLTDVGDALELTVKLYSETDEAAADELKRLIADNPVPKRVDQPEPRMPVGA